MLRYGLVAFLLVLFGLGLYQAAEGGGGCGRASEGCAKKRD